MTKPDSESPCLFPYHYQKLNASVREIRLLNLKKGRMGDPIECALGIISLDDQQVPAYYALSYVWGSAADTREMTLENHAFCIAANLHTGTQPSVSCVDPNLTSSFGQMQYASTRMISTNGAGRWP